MISSAEVQQMIAQQQQMMAGQLDYSYQTSMGYMGGIGSFGSSQAPILPPMGLPPPMTPQGVPYMGHNQAGFNYGGRMGYGMGNQMGMGAVGAVNSSASLANTAISLSTMYGGFKAARVAGAGMGGAAFAGATAMGVGSVAGMGMQFAASNMYAGAQEQQAVYGVLGQNFNQVNGGSRTGRGFSRQDSRAISDFTRELQSVPEMMTSMSELTRIMNQISQMGMMHGAKTAQEFGKKFKENINTLKEISKVMQTTMEESIQYMSQAKQAGFYSPQGIKAHVAQSQFTSGLSGMSMQQLNQLSQAGSQMSFGTGGYRRSGANAALRAARQIGVANEMGFITNDQIHEMTGMEGPEGIGALSENLTAASYRMARGGLGTAMSIAVGEQDSSGRFTGNVDNKMVERIRSGGITKDELLHLARAKTSGKASKISWARQKDRLRSEMSSAVGVEGMTMELQELLGGRGWDNPDVTNLVMQRFGVDERTAGAVQKMGQNMGAIQSEIGKKAQVEGRRQAENAMRGEQSWDAMKRRFSKKMENYFEEPFKHLGSEMSDAVSSYVEDFMDGLMDRYSVELSRNTADLVAGAMSGNKSSQAKISEMAGKFGGVTSTTMSATSSFGDSLASLMGTTSQNKERYDFLDSLPGKFVTRNGGNLSQSAGQEKAFRDTVGKTGSGIFSGGLLKSFNGLGQGGGMLARGFSDFMNKNNAALGDMSQKDRLNFIRSKFLDGDASGFAGRLLEGNSPEEVIALLQRKSGSSSLAGAFKPGDYLGERYGTGTFESGPELAKKVKASSEALASKFGDQKSAVLAMLHSDTKERSLFLAASSGDRDAQRFITDDLSPQERGVLARKYGVSEDAGANMRKMYGGAGGANVKDLAEAVGGDLARGSMAAEAAQFRKMGGEMAGRLAGVKGYDLFHGGVDKKLNSFISKLQGVDSPDGLIKLVGKGGSMSDDVRSVMDTVRGLSGAARDQALDVLGPSARAAINSESGMTRSLNRGGKKALAAIRDGADEDIKDFIDQHVGKKGTLSKKDQAELVKMISDRKFAGGISQSGQMATKDIENQTKLTEELTKFVEASSAFAQIVYQTVPAAKDAATALQNSKPKMEKKTN